MQDNSGNRALATASMASAASETLLTLEGPSEDDDRLVALWLHGRSAHTIRAYHRDVGRFRAWVQKPLRAVTLGDLQGFADSLSGADSSRGRVLASVKSLLTFASRLGAIPFNVGAALQKVKARDTLSVRILSEAEVAKMLALTSGRDHALVRLAYAGGFRVSELVGLRWADLAEASDGTAFLTVFGKGGKTRTVRVSAPTAMLLRELRGQANASAPMFVGRGGTALHASQAWRIVRGAAALAAIGKGVSPHWLRHAHASHALDRGAKVTVVRDTLGHSSIAVTDRYAHARPGESSGLCLAV